MQVQVINTIQQFANLKKTWDRLYAADPNATIFVSWAWLRGWIENLNAPWLVLCTRPDKNSPYVGFLPLFQKNVGKSKIHLFRELHMGGNPWSDHTGFVCEPAHEENAIKSLTTYMQHRMKWEWFHMANVFDPRLNFFLKHFSSKRFDIQESDSTSCPYLTLPETWDRYLEGTLGPNMRRSIRKSLRNMDKLPNFHITCHQNGDFESNVETLCRLSWGPRPEVISWRFRMVLPRLHFCSEEGSLWLKIFWDGQTPISALAGFIDRQKKTFSAFNTGYDSRYSKLSPGTAIIAYSIRDAIQSGFKVYDFLRGSEAYKVINFGAKEGFNRNIMITRKSFWLTARKMKKRLKSFLT
jgi:CelD/BcsL family acetyltransferase involved in cellulose biosynthesis